MARLTPSGGNDKVYTPLHLAKLSVEFTIEVLSLPSTSTILEPSSGTGAFLNALDGCKVESCEIDLGTNFFDYKKRVDLIITNPPWSQTRKFLNHAMCLSDNISFLIPLNHILGLKARMRDMAQMGFWVTDVLLVDTPKEFPQSGFQLAIVIIRKTETKTTVFHNRKDFV